MAFENKNKKKKKKKKKKQLPKFIRKKNIIFKLFDIRMKFKKRFELILIGLVQFFPHNF